MEMFIIFLIIVVIYGGFYLIWRFFDNRKFKKNISNNAQKESTKSNENILKSKNDNKNVVKNETITVNNDGQNEEIVLGILEEYGDIKKIDEDIITNKGNKIYSLKGNIDTFWGDSDDGAIPGNNIFISNEHVIITKYDGDIDNSSDYYININNINKITRKNSSYDVLEDEEWVVPIATFIIYTKSNNSLELVYPNEILIPDDHCPMVIKKTDNSILFEYIYDMKNDGIDVEYELNDSQLKIGKNRYFNPTKPDSREYEIVANYSNITDTNIVNRDDFLNVIIKTNSKNDYVLVFDDDNKATKFYNELKTHLESFKK